MSTYETIQLDATPGGVAMILLQRSTLNFKMVEELADALETLRGEDQLRMVILRGAGDDFCSGIDPHWFELAQDYTKDQNEDEAYALAEMLRKLKELPQLTVALVEGPAVSTGIGLIAACDVAVAMEDANFQFDDVRFGLIPAVIAPYIAGAIGPRWAKALFLTGESFDADYAEGIGLVHYTVSNETEMEDMLEYLSKLAFENAPGAVSDIKRLFADTVGKSFDKDLSHTTAKYSAGRWQTEEGIEGVNAFLASRAPKWSK